VEAVGNLHGLCRAAASSFGAVRPAVATDDRDQRPGSQPADDGIGLPIRQQVDDLPTRAIDQNRAVALAPPQTPVVNAHELRHGQGRQWSSTDLAHEGIRACHQSERAPQLRPSLAAQGESHRT